MFRLQRKQRHDIPEKAQLSKYYEMDGALRAYANRMAVLGLLCGMRDGLIASWAGHFDHASARAEAKTRGTLPD